jgi:hypothetical protein
MLKKMFVLIMCIVIMLTVFTFQPMTSHAFSDFSWTFSNNQNFSTQLGNCDTFPCYYWDSATSTYKHISSLPAYVYSGTTIDNMSNTGRTPSISGAPGGDNQYWFNWIWNYNGTYYAIIHDEYNYGQPFGNSCRIVLAHCTTPNLDSWTYDGILLSPPSGGEGCYDPGFVSYGNNLYIVYHTSFQNWSGLCIARAAANNFGPGNWYKWNGSSYSSAGQGGSEYFILGNNSNTLYAAPSISWNTYLNKFVMVYNDVSTWVANGHGDTSGCHFDIAVSTDTNNLASWSAPETFMTNSQMGGWHCYKALAGIGTSGFNGHDNFWQEGQNCRIYYCSNGSGPWSQDVTFSLGSGGGGTTLSHPGNGSDYNGIYGSHWAGESFTAQGSSISQVSVWVNQANNVDMTAGIYTDSGFTNLIGSTTFTTRTTGKVTANFSSPVSVSNGTTYYLKMTSPSGTAGSLQQCNADSSIQGYWEGGTSSLDMAFELVFGGGSGGNTLSHPGNGSDFNGIFGSHWAGESFAAQGSRISQVSIWVNHANNADMTAGIYADSGFTNLIGSTTFTTRTTGKVTANFTSQVNVSNGTTYYLKITSPSWTAGSLQQCNADGSIQGYWEGGTSGYDMAFELVFN